MKLIFSPVPRSGSTALCEYIAYSSESTLSVEPYNPECNENRQVTLKDKFEEIQTYDIIKILGWPLDILDNFEIIDVAEKIIFLYRESVLDTMLSNIVSMTYSGDYKIYSKHRLKNSFQNDVAQSLLNDFYSEVRPPIDLKEFAVCYFDFIKNIQCYYNYVKFYHSNKTLIVKYEDLYSENQSLELDKIMHFLNLQAKNIDSLSLMDASNKLNNYDTYKKIIPNLDEVMNWHKCLNENECLSK